MRPRPSSDGSVPSIGSGSAPLLHIAAGIAAIIAGCGSFASRGAADGTCRAAPARAMPCWRPRAASRKPGIEPERDRDDRHEHRDAETAPDPFAGAERALHRREDRPPTSSASASEVAAPAA